MALPNEQTSDAAGDSFEQRRELHDAREQSIASPASFWAGNGGIPGQQIRSGNRIWRHAVGGGSAWSARRLCHRLGIGKGTRMRVGLIAERQLDACRGVR